ncbi:hypothetical protein [Labrenzia sp. PHM005]|uniref:hypothetical protein n=1 Tax=Labrenzia sp. PHM005 TaxID=2590016 RepID=UPI0011405A99|nr:hypothetical protein [Labrenzia sp. PHM005]QDG75683.1 hypothetical protein FJ695_07310 [Labrenzia sp. PHM005]
MINSFSKEISRKFTAPVVAAVFVMAAGAVSGAQAMPLSGKGAIPASQAEHIVNVDHRRGPGKGWRGGHGRHHHAMGPRQIRRSLRHRGFYRIKIIDRRGPMYIIKAHGWRGFPMRLVVDSRNAHIVRSRPLGPRFDWNYSW